MPILFDQVQQVHDRCTEKVSTTHGTRLRTVPQKLQHHDSSVNTPVADTQGRVFEPYRTAELTTPRFKSTHHRQLMVDSDDGTRSPMAIDNGSFLLRAVHGQNKCCLQCTALSHRSNAQGRETTDKHMCCIAERPTQTTWRGVQVEQSAHLFITTRVVVFEKGYLCSSDSSEIRLQHLLFNSIKL